MTDVVATLVAIAATVFAAVQLWLAWLANQESKAQHEADTQRADAARADDQQRQRLEDRRLTLGILADLTTMEVEEAKLQAPTSEVHLRYLRGLHHRTAATYELLNDVGNVEGYLEDRVRAELQTIAVIDPRGTAESTAVIQAKGGDRSRYSWAGEGSYTKHQILQRLALAFAADRGLTTPEAFASAIAPELATAVGDGRADPTRFLQPVQGSDGAHVRVAERIGPLVLDGEPYVVRHTLGSADAKDYGTRVQVPVIRHLSSLGYPVGPVGPVGTVAT